MSDNKFLKICGISSLLAVLVYILSTVMSLVAGLTKPETIADVGTYLESWYNAKSIMSLYGWFGILGSLFTIPAVLGYYQLLKKEKPMQWIPAAIIFHGVVLLTIAYLIPLVISHSIAPNYTTASDPTDKSALAAIAFALVKVEDFSIIIGSVLTLATGIALIALIDLKPSVLPKWFNWFGIVTGFLSFTMLGTFLKGTAGSIFSIFMIIDLVLMLIWMAMIAIFMFKPQKEEQAVKA